MEVHLNFLAVFVAALTSIFLRLYGTLFFSVSYGKSLRAFQI